ncbi:MAG: carbonic anhydrase [Gammaproteobacteria bacterium]|nr:carbonic anhydrase [Gammaproteobacteria bacterium]
MISPADALQRLRDGNQRFVSGDAVTNSTVNRGHQPELAKAQTPFAIVLACSDSRVPTELIFDQGFGDLFVIRVAGNIVAPSQIGSIEFAAKQFGTRLVVVLGHSNCGAIVATLDELAKKVDLRSPNLRAIVDRVKPAVEPVLAQHGQDETHDVVGDSVRANVRASVERLSHGSLIIESLIAGGDLQVIGAEYSMETGNVEFFEAL